MSRKTCSQFERKFSLTRENILGDLEWAFQMAIETGNMSAAIRAKELQGKEMGLFITSTTGKANQKKLKDLTKVELLELLKEVESLCGAERKKKGKN